MCYEDGGEDENESEGESVVMGKDLEASGNLNKAKRKMEVYDNAGEGWVE
ncbi:44900_t:CDS:2, partial [Gigaspora margarita]